MSNKHVLICQGAMKLFWWLVVAKYLQLRQFVAIPCQLPLHL